MSRKAYSDEERARIRRGMVERATSVVREKGLRDTGIEDIYVPEGISKTFFYTFFPSKPALMTEVLAEQTHAILEGLRANVWEYGADNGLRETLRELVAGKWYITSIDDQEYLRSALTEEEFLALMNGRIVLFAEIQDILGIPVSRLDPRVLYNLLMSLVWTCRMDSDALPLLYREAMNRTTEIQIDQVARFLATLRVGSEQF